MVRKLAVRKVLRVARELHFVNVIVTASLALAILGFLLYAFYTSSSVVLMEGFIWLIEALSFFSLMIALRIAASRAAFYGARYEIFRVESFAVVLVSLVAAGITSFNIFHTLRILAQNLGGETPIEVSAYLLGSAVTSYIMSSRCKKVLEVRKVFVLTAKTIEEKLRLDVAFEAGAGIAVIISNVFNMPLIESMVALAMGFYVLMGVALIAREAFLNLIGIGSRELVARTRRNVLNVVKSVSRFRVRKLLVETFGSFAEIELWLEAPPNMTLSRAHRHAVSIAREIVLRVPEVIRALVLIVPQSSTQLSVSRHSYYRRLPRKARRVDRTRSREQVASRSGDEVRENGVSEIQSA